MTGYKQGDVVLVPQLLHGSGDEAVAAKKRPALVLSSLEHNEATGEVVIAQITGHLSSPPRSGDYRIESWREANLLQPAMVRCRLATLKCSAVVRPLGELSEADLQGVKKTLNFALPG